MLFRKQLILLFFSKIPLQNKARFVSAEHSYSNWKKLSLNEAVGKINCKNSSRPSLWPSEDLCYSKSLKKKNPPRRDALFKNKTFCYAITKAETSERETTAHIRERNFWKFLK